MAFMGLGKPTSLLNKADMIISNTISRRASSGSFAENCQEIVKKFEQNTKFLLAMCFDVNVVHS